VGRHRDAFESCCLSSLINSSQYPQDTQSNNILLISTCTISIIAVQDSNPCISPDIPTGHVRGGGSPVRVGGFPQKILGLYITGKPYLCAVQRCTFVLYSLFHCSLSMQYDSKNRDVCHRKAPFSPALFVSAGRTTGILSPWTFRHLIPCISLLARFMQLNEDRVDRFVATAPDKTGSFEWEWRNCRIFYVHTQICRAKHAETFKPGSDLGSWVSQLAFPATLPRDISVSRLYHLRLEELQEIHHRRY